MVNHVKLSDDWKHGPRDEVPDTFNLKACEEIADYPHVSGEDHDRFVCTDCGQVCKARSGLGVHLRRTNDQWHRELPDSEPIDYDRHTRLPAIPHRREIVVPSETFLSAVELTDQEEQDGWSVRVDPNMIVPRPPTGRDGNQVTSWSLPSPHTDDVLNELRRELGEFVEDDEDMDPTEVYERVRDILATPA